MTSHIRSERSSNILIIRIDRPERKNALTHEMYGAITALLKNADEDDAIRVIVLTGSGDVFTAGNNLGDFLKGIDDTGDSPAVQFLRQLSSMRKPVIAAVNGLAIGIGTTLLLHCDMIVAAEDARFQLPFVNLGLTPEAASSYLLPKIAGFHLASELLLTGRSFGAETAWRCNLVNKIVARDEVESIAVEEAKKISSYPSEAVMLTKQLLKHSDAEKVSEVMTAELKIFKERLKSPEAKEAFSAFLEKRAPDFSKF